VGFFRLRALNVSLTKESKPAFAIVLTENW